MPALRRLLKPDVEIAFMADGCLVCIGEVYFPRCDGLLLSQITFRGLAHMLTGRQ